MASRTTLLWLERLVWICIYGGLLTVVLAIFVARSDEATAWTMTVTGGIFVAFGMVLIYLRSRLKETPMIQHIEKIP